MMTINRKPAICAQAPSTLPVVAMLACARVRIWRVGKLPFELRTD